ncbi:hypothetical protein ACH5RR_019195 [Cinchona calisaya]|uniref:SOSEKI DIX-like domain-containing protein n=1 Tax=Cinchona calisaya TaxID=153742 RepID=A0ABD2ZNP4_9GENT
MAVANSRLSTEMSMPKKWNERSERSPERTKIWSEQPKFNSILDGKVPVIYYLTRNGHLEHPHFIQVPLSSSHGLYLKDVMNKLNFQRGNGMAYMYSWSSKRSYKNGYVWQDLSEDDLIHPTNDHDYILKGSELPQTSTTVRSLQQTNETHDSSAHSRRKKNQSWSSFDNSAAINSFKNNEYRVYKCESSRELGGSRQADMATQTDDKRRRRSMSLKEEHCNKSVELSREELSPPSMTSSEGLDGVSGSVAVDRRAIVVHRTAENECNIGRIKPSRVFNLMQLITCGSSIAVKDHGSMKKKVKMGYLMGMKCGNTVLRDVENL